LPSQKAQVLRVLWAQRNEAQRYATRCFNRVNNIILRFGHTIGAVFPIRSHEAAALLDELCEGLIPDHPNVSPIGLPAHVAEVVAELYSKGEIAKKASKEAAAIAVKYVGNNLWPTQEGEMTGVKLLGNLQSIPGCGEVTALAWMTQVCDPRRFSNAKQVAAFAGCDPSLKISAGKVTQHVRRRGNVVLHDALVQASVSVLNRASTPLGRWGAEIARKHDKGGFRKAVGAISRKIAIALWHVHRKGEPYDESGYKSLSGVRHKPGLQLDGKTFVLDRPSHSERKQNASKRRTEKPSRTAPLRDSRVKKTPKRAKR
jgi:transposase